MRCDLNINSFLFLLIAFFLVSNFCYSQQKKEVKWLNIQEVEALMKKKPKKVIIDVYTDWCGWCKTMDKKTYSDSVIVNFINQNYYPVKLDAETRENLIFLGKNYVYQDDYRCNELAVQLLNGQMSYPHTVFMDEKFNVLTAIAGFINQEEFLPILTYFGKNHYKTMKWEEYKANNKH